MRISVFLFSLFLSTAALAGPLPYNETADAKAELNQTIAAAKDAHLPVLIIFGANWCGDCRALDAALATGKNAELMAQQFKVVKIDVGNFNRNLDITAAYDNPTKKGIPAAVLISPDNKVLYATKAGELANARRMSETGIYDFFKNIAQAQAPAAKQ